MKKAEGVPAKAALWVGERRNRGVTIFSLVWAPTTWVQNCERKVRVETARSFVNIEDSVPGDSGFRGFPHCSSIPRGTCFLLIKRKSLVNPNICVTDHFREIFKQWALSFRVKIGDLNSDGAGASLNAMFTIV